MTKKLFKTLQVGDVILRIGGTEPHKIAAIQKPGYYKLDRGWTACVAATWTLVSRAKRKASSCKKRTSSKPTEAQVLATAKKMHSVLHSGITVNWNDFPINHAKWLRLARWHLKNK